jgi:plastocyanin
MNKEAVKMKKGIIIGAVVVVVIALGGWYVAANKSNNKSNSDNMGDMNMPSSSSNSGSSNKPQATNAVTIQNFAFSPSSITVKKGTKVTWTNKDSVAHTVNETDGKTGPNSSDVNPGSSYSFTFNSPGTYHYHCAIHPSMLGTVVVTQ